MSLFDHTIMHSVVVSHTSIEARTKFQLSIRFWRNDIKFQALRAVKTTGPTWALTFGLALRHAPEVVGITEAAAVKEMRALLTPAVIVIARQQASAGAGGLRQMTRGLIVWGE